MIDVLVYGATPGGIGAAIAASRRGRKVLLLEPSPFIGGMMASGLGRTDILSLESSGGIFREYTTRIVEYYTSLHGPDSEQVKACNRGLWFEPSAAAHVLWEMLAGIEVRTEAELVSVLSEGERLAAATFTCNGETFTIRAGVFIDATYEGDLAAMAGVPYSLGRESRDEWNEEFAGRLYMPYDTKEVFPGSTGVGDRRIQAYNFRLCLTDVPANRVPVTQPENYSRDDYTSLVADVAEGRVQSIRHVMNILPVPNGKTDTNNHHAAPISTDLPEENTDYPDGDKATRAAIVRRHREYIQGLLWFLQNDPELPAEFRAEAAQWGYAADEFSETGHFPHQIYVREARRIHGEYTFTENDARLAPGLEMAPIHYDSVAMGDYHIDSHAVRKREPEGQNLALEGFLGLDWLTKTYQIPYGVMVPQVVDGLLVSVAVSATHMGFGTIRMEPVWMQLGFAAGVAADLALELRSAPRDLPVDGLQHALLEHGQRISYLADVEWEHPARAALEYFGTKGFFTSNTVRPGDPVTVAEASQWIARARSLPGGNRIPALPATDRILPAGEDMGPRRPTKDFRPALYWAGRPHLPLGMAQRWLGVAARVAGIEVPDAEGPTDRSVTRGEFCQWLYELLR